MRTLRRPMFRRGGSTGEGITSGLAPRQGYAHGDNVQPRRPNTNLNNFLIDFGLDLVSRPPSGGIFATAGAAAKEPFGRFQERGAAQKDREWERGLHKEKMDFEREKFKEEKEQFGKEHALEKYRIDVESKGEKQFLEERLHKYWDPIIDAETDLIKKKKLERDREWEIHKIVDLGYDISDEYKILNNQEAMEIAADNADIEIKNAINPDTKVVWTEDDAGYGEFYQSLINKYMRLATKFLDPVKAEKDAAGGRVGRALGGGMTEDVNVMTETPGGISDINVSETIERDPGETNEINISYEQLRDRLPQEISNEIVLLLSESYEAFADFAEIQTQADVNEFNTKYNVQLFLPQQSGV